MNQIELYKKRSSLLTKLNDKMEEIYDLDDKIKKLPKCPCCEGNIRGLCLIDHLHGCSSEHIKKFAKICSIDLEHVQKAVIGEYTLTKDELSNIIAAINNSTN